MPLLKRKQILRRIVPVQPAPVLYADHFDARGVDLFRSVCDMDLERIVAKRKDGLYTPEETSWVKIKNPRYSQAEGREEFFENGWHGISIGLRPIRRNDGSESSGWAILYGERV